MSRYRTQSFFRSVWPRLSLALWRLRLLAKFGASCSPLRNPCIGGPLNSGGQPAVGRLLKAFGSYFLLGVSRFERQSTTEYLRWLSCLNRRRTSRVLDYLRPREMFTPPKGHHPALRRRSMERRTGRLGVPIRQHLPAATIIL